MTVNLKKHQNTLLVLLTTNTLVSLHLFLVATVTLTTISNAVELELILVI